MRKATYKALKHFYHEVNTFSRNASQFSWQNFAGIGLSNVMFMSPRRVSCWVLKSVNSAFMFAVCKHDC